MSRFELFTRFALFDGLTADDMLTLLARVNLDFVHYGAGDFLCREGEESKGLLLLMDGTVTVGDETAEAPAIIQYSHLYGADTRSPRTARADTACSVMRISPEALKALLQADARVLSNYLNLLSDDNRK